MILKALLVSIVTMSIIGWLIQYIKAISIDIELSRKAKKCSSDEKWMYIQKDGVIK